MAPYFETKAGRGREQALTEPTWAGEVISVIYQLNNRNAVGADNITAGVLLRNKDWLSPLITDILRAGQYNNMMNNEWIQGLVTPIRKNKDPLAH